MSGQQVHDRLKKHGYEFQTNCLSEQERELIRWWYASVDAAQIKSGDFDLPRLAEILDRPHSNICRAARQMGLTNKGRKKSDKLSERAAKNTSALWKIKPHPRGMLGKKHNPETREKFSKSTKLRFKRERGTEKEARRIEKMMRTKEKNGTLHPHRKRGSWKQAWAEVGGKRIFCRSSWEVNYAHLLEDKKQSGIIKDWQHEPETFWFEKIRRGVRSYKPDFKITWADDLSVEYHEIKGWMDAKSKTKLKRMKIYHPDVSVIVLNEKKYKLAISLKKIPNEKKHVARIVDFTDRQNVVDRPDWLG